MIFATSLLLLLTLASASNPLEVTQAWIQHLLIPGEKMKGTIESLVSLNEFVQAGARKSSIVFNFFL